MITVPIFFFYREPLASLGEIRAILISRERPVLRARAPHDEFLELCLVTGNNAEYNAAVKFPVIEFIFARFIADASDSRLSLALVYPALFLKDRLRAMDTYAEKRSTWEFCAALLQLRGRLPRALGEITLETNRDLVEIIAA